jgi:hypothetical protein
MQCGSISTFLARHDHVRSKNNTTCHPVPLPGLHANTNAPAVQQGRWATESPGDLREVVAQVPPGLRGADAAQCLSLDLARSLAGHTDRLADFFQCSVLAIRQPVAQG